MNSKPFCVNIRSSRSLAHAKQAIFIAKTALAGYHYSNLEDPETREIAQNDPKAYLGQFSGKVIIDEIQRVPELLSYLQVEVDRLATADLS